MKITVTQIGTVPLSGTFNLSLVDPISNRKITTKINVDSSYNTLYNTLQKISPIFLNCLIFQNIIENNNLNSFHWNITLNANSLSPIDLKISSAALYGKGASVTIRQISIPNAKLSGSFSLYTGISSASSVSVTISDTALQFQSKLNSLAGVYGVNVTKKVSHINMLFMYTNLMNLKI